MNLWEANHRYYCNEGNYYHNGDGAKYSSWSDFLSEEGGSDMDYNLLFRWDWEERDPETEESTFNGDAYYRNGRLLLFWMGQRKGLYRWSEVSVCRADEPAVREWLKPRMEHLFSLWEPLDKEA